MLQGKKRRVGRAAAFALPVMWVLAVLAWELLLPTSTHVPQLLSVAPALACAATGRRGGVVLGGAFALLAVFPVDAASGSDADSRLGSCGAILATVAAAYFAAARRSRLAGDLARAREVAEAAQQAVVHPLPDRLGGLALAGGYLSSTRGAALGGDLYAAEATRHGVRIVIGDVRGHGLAAIGTVSAALGVFREAAHDEPRLDGVLRRLERGLARGREAGPEGAEEFLTVLLLEISADGRAVLLNCGHPWPYRLTPSGAERPAAAVISEAEPLPPLGMFPLPTRLPEVLPVRLAPGEGLFLCTDGAADARDVRRDFFPLEPALCRAAARADPEETVACVREELLRHSGGRLADDVALLALRTEPRPAGPLTRGPEAHAFG